MAISLLAAVALALPVHGVVVPGKSLGGVRLGDSPAHVRARWGSKFGVCKSCSNRTWYYNYVPFAPQGAGVSFDNSRVVSVFTLWAPTGWRTSQGLRIGDAGARLTKLYRRLQLYTCSSYLGYVLNAPTALTVFYVVNAKIWGFALSRRSVPVCR
jgi:hypothetical protein